MRTHTQEFKEGLKNYGREFNDSLTFYDNNNTGSFVLPSNINNIRYSTDTNILKSVMQQLTLDINSNVDINTYKRVDYNISLKNITGSINFQRFIPTKKEEQKDKKSYIYTCYDNMIKTMVDYTTPIVNGSAITYPITIRDYINAICSHLGITFGSSTDTFTNYDKQITGEHYLDSDGNSLGYTFRDVLDDIAECVGGFICINDLGQLVVRYISQAVGTKNMYEYKSRAMSNQVTTTYDITDGALILNGTANNTWVDLTSDTPLVLNTGTYTFSTKTKKPYIIRLRVTYSDNTTGNFNIAKNTLSKTFTTSKQIIKQRVFIYEDNTLSGTQFDNEKIYLQLEKGNQATAYEPYYDTINEEYFSDKNVNIKEKYGPINKLVTNIGTPRQDAQSITDNGLCEIDILDNPILDQSNGDSFLDGIFANLNGLEYYLNDFQTNGILYYEVGDKYNVSIDSNTYDCLLLSDNIKRTTGLKENINTEEPKQNEAPYKYESSLERSSRNAYIIANKSEGRIDQIVTAVGDNGQVTSASIIQSINNDTSQTQIDADKIDIEANDVLNILSGNQINLTSKNISINSTNFSVDSNGNMTCNNATINGGNLDIIDNGTQQQSDSHIVIKSSDSTKRNYLTSNVVDLWETKNIGGDNYLLRAVYYPGYSNISFTSEDYSDERYTNTHYSGVYIYRKLNNVKNYVIVNPQIIRAQYNDVTKFEVDTETGDTTIGGYVEPQSILAKEGRLSTPNFNHQYPNNKASERFDICSSSMDSSGMKPSGGDGFLKTFFWDNTGQYDTQLFIPNGLSSNSKLQIRSNNASQWQNNWKDIPILDGFDYGDWTPFYLNCTFSNYEWRNCKYIKLGKIVILVFHDRPTISSVAGNGNAIITGLPYAPVWPQTGGGALGTCQITQEHNVPTLAVNYDYAGIELADSTNDGASTCHFKTGSGLWFDGVFVYICQ